MISSSHKVAAIQCLADASATIEDAFNYAIEGEVSNGDRRLVLSEKRRQAKEELARLHRILWDEGGTVRSPLASKAIDVICFAGGPAIFVACWATYEPNFPGMAVGVFVIACGLLRKHWARVANNSPA